MRGNLLCLLRDFLEENRCPKKDAGLYLSLEIDYIQIE